MSRLYSHPREYRKVFLGNYLCIGFVPGGRPFSRLILWMSQERNAKSRAIREERKDKTESLLPSYDLKLTKNCSVLVMHVLKSWGIGWSKLAYIDPFGESVAKYMYTIF